MICQTFRRIARLFRSEVCQEPLFQRQHLFGMLLADRLDGGVGLRRGEARVLQRLHGLLLKENEAGAHVPRLNQTVERRNAVVEVPPRKEDGQHGLESRANGGHKRGQLRDVFWLVLHDLFPRLFLLHLIQAHREALGVHPPRSGIVLCQPQQLADVRHLLPDAVEGLAVDLDHIHMQQIVL